MVFFRHDGEGAAVAPADVAAVIRLCYFPRFDEKNRLWRFAFFREHVLPRLLAQTVPTDVWVWVHERHLEESREFFGPDVHLFTVDLKHPRYVRFAETEIMGYPWQAVRGMPMYRYQVLMGSDDLVAPDFVEVSIRALDPYLEPRALATHFPSMIDVRTGKCYEMAPWPRPSPFVVLRQRPLSVVGYTWVWARAHNHLQRIVDRVVYLPAGRAFMAVHDYNDGTRVNLEAPQIPRPDWLTL